MHPHFGRIFGGRKRGGNVCGMRVDTVILLQSSLLLKKQVVHVRNIKGHAIRIFKNLEPELKGMIFRGTKSKFSHWVYKWNFDAL